MKKPVRQAIREARLANEGAGLTHSSLIVTDTEAQGMATPKLSGYSTWDEMVRRNAMKASEEAAFLDWLQGNGVPVLGTEGGKLDSLYRQFRSED